DLVDGIVGAMVEECCPANKPPEDWDWKGIRAGFVDHFGKKSEKIEHFANQEDLAREMYKQAELAMVAKEEELGTELFLRVFRHYYLEDIDKQWVEHLTNMEHLRDGIGLRGYGQRDPKQEYKKEGYDIFVGMMAAVSSNVGSKLAKVQVRKETDVDRMEREDAARHAQQQQQMIMRHGGEVDPGADVDEAPAQGPVSGARPQRVVAQPVRRESPKIGRNDPCPCGSGLKFKKCHGAALEEEGATDTDDANP
ncbi:MAG TPA: SEC-C metal-binding domain-containing protein, partial [Polyangiaceae bacterium]|nr:SEC-C metal-binding domain-containing protein [Polyangiaceae bacterium]